MPHQHDRALIGTAQRAGETKRLVVVGIDAIPPKRVVEVFSERLLNQPVFAVDVGNHGLLHLRFEAIEPDKLHSIVPKFPVRQFSNNRMQPGQSGSFCLNAPFPTAEMRKLSTSSALLSMPSKTVRRFWLST